MSEDYVECTTEQDQIPADISKSGIKAIRRLQSLPAGHLHILALLKLAGQWFLFCITGSGIKIEKLS